ncbi:MAG: ABC transporter permease [Chthoniobacterales bacterium]
MQSLSLHLRYTLRLLRKSPGFTTTAVLILGFGIDINTAIFSLINATMLRPLPFPEPDRLVEVCTPYQHDMTRWTSYPDYLDIARAQHTFESLSVIAVPQTLDLGGKGEAQRVQVYFVSPSLTKVTGLPVKLGRWISDQEDVPHGPLVAVLSEPFWRSRFQADPSIVGKNITLSGRSFQVIGVAPLQASTCGPPAADVYAPTNAIATAFNWNLVEDRGGHYVDCLGRLKKGVSIQQAQAELEIIHNNLISRYPDTDAGSGLRVIPLSERVVIFYSQTVWLLGVAAGCLLLISAANVSNLLYARAVERRQEMSIRSALGGTRSRLLTQSLLETSFLSLLGAILGAGIAILAVEMIKKLAPPDLYRLAEVNIDLNALVFVCGLTGLVSLLSGPLPAWKLSTTDVPSVLKAEGDRGSTSGRERQFTQAFMVVAQVTIACVLLIGAGLLTRSYVAVQSLPTGFNPHQVLTAEIALTSAKYTFDAARANALWDEVLTKLRTLPGVETVAMNYSPPLKTGIQIMVPFTIDGQPDPGPGHRPVLNFQMVSPDFFRSLQVPLLAGRDFGAQDRMDAQRVVIVDEALAAEHWPGKSAIGQVVRFDGSQEYVVVGVAAHVRFLTPDDEGDTCPSACFPYSQDDLTGEVLLIRAKGDPMALVAELRKVIASIDPDVALGRIASYDDIISDRYLARKLGVILVNVFSCAALFLAAIGLYGTLAYSVNQRTREIGIRIALGASSPNILKLVAKRGLALVGVGLTIGIFSALACNRFVESLLYGVKGDDPVTLGLAVSVLCVAATIACLLPAHRATRIDPIIALRQ